MNKETFIAFMKLEDWDYIGKPDVTNMSGICSSGAEINWDSYAKQNQFQRGNCIASITDEDMEELTNETFWDWFDRFVKIYYFPGDWKKAFKGSEFLIPVVEKEIKFARMSVLQDLNGKLHSVKEGYRSIEEVIAIIEEELYNS